MDPVLVNHYLKALEAPSEPLTEWEAEFLISVTDQWHHRARLSMKQLEILTRLYEAKG